VQTRARETHSYDDSDSKHKAGSGHLDSPVDIAAAPLVRAPGSVAASAGEAGTGVTPDPARFLADAAVIAEGSTRSSSAGDPLVQGNVVADQRSV
jgi:hypothetical protein